MTTPTMIRTYRTDNDIAAVITVQTPLGFTAHFQLYQAGVDNPHLRYEILFGTEQKAIAVFNRFLEVWRYANHPDNNQPEEAYEDVSWRLRQYVDAYVEAQVAEGYTDTVAEKEVLIFLGILAE